MEKAKIIDDVIILKEGKQLCPSCGAVIRLHVDSQEMDVKINGESVADDTSELLYLPCCNAEAQLDESIQ